MARVVKALGVKEVEKCPACMLSAASRASL